MLVKSPQRAQPYCVLYHSHGNAERNSEEGWDDVKSAWPLRLGLHPRYMPYNGCRNREVERIPERAGLSSDCRLQLAYMKPSCSNRRSAYGGEYVPGLVHTAPSRHESWQHPKAGAPTARRQPSKVGSVIGTSRNKVAVPEGAAGSPPSREKPSFDPSVGSGRLMAPRLIARSIRFSSSQGERRRRKGSGDRSRPGEITENRSRHLLRSGSLPLSRVKGASHSVPSRSSADQWLAGQGAGRGPSERTAVRERGRRPATQA